MIRVGCKVKVEDVGQLLVCTQTGRSYIEVELEGVRFWILKRLCKLV